MIYDDTQEHALEEENYFVSMTDLMVGLVFIFIILLMYYVVQFKKETQELSGANTTRAEILEELKKTLKEQGVQIEVDQDNGILRLPSAILFDSGNAQLSEEGRQNVRKLAEALLDVLPCYAVMAEEAKWKGDRACLGTHKIESVYIEGHTDSDPVTNVNFIKDNWDLSVMRATNTYREMLRGVPELEYVQVEKYSLHKQVIIRETIMSVSGYGPQRPVSENKDENRRIDLRLIMKMPNPEGENLIKRK